MKNEVVDLRHSITRAINEADNASSELESAISRLNEAINASSELESAISRLNEAIGELEEAKEMLDSLPEHQDLCSDIKKIILPLARKSNIEELVKATQEIVDFYTKEPEKMKYKLDSWNKMWEVGTV